MNTIYLTSKRYIFRVSKQEKILDVKEYQEYLNTVYIEQEYLAKLQFKHAAFVKTWSTLSGLFVNLNNRNCELVIPK